MISPYQYPEFRYIKMSEFWKSCQSVSCQLEVYVQRVNCWRWVFLFLSCLHPGNYVQTDHPKRQVSDGLYYSLLSELHLALVSALVVVTTILLQWCPAKILLHLVPYPNDDVPNSNRRGNIVSHLVPNPAMVL